MCFGQFQGKADGEEDDAVETKDENGENDVAALAESDEKAAGCGGSEQSGDPDLNEKRDGKSDVPCAATERALQEREFHPGSDAGGNGQTGNAPAGLDAEKARKGQGGEVSKSAGENNSYDGETQRGARVAESVESRGVETA